jgi:hypothetical protein
MFLFLGARRNCSSGSKGEEIGSPFSEVPAREVRDPRMPEHPAAQTEWRSSSPNLDADRVTPKLFPVPT